MAEVEAYANREGEFPRFDISIGNAWARLCALSEAL